MDWNVYRRYRLITEEEAAGVVAEHGTVPDIALGLRAFEIVLAQRTDALPWLSGRAPAVFDAVIDAVEPLPGDGTDDPAPFCERCGADIGVFLRFGLDWRHYRGSTLSDIELFDPAMAPLLAWRRTATAAI